MATRRRASEKSREQTVVREMREGAGGGLVIACEVVIG